MIPAALADLDETHAGFAEPPRHQALPRKRSFRARLYAVSIENRLRLLENVEQLRNLALHAEAQLIRFDNAVDRIGSLAGFIAKSRFIAWIRSICLRCSRVSAARTADSADARCR